MAALIYLAVLAGSLLALAVLLRRRPTPTTPLAPVPAPAGSTGSAETEIRTILLAAAQLASRYHPAA